MLDVRAFLAFRQMLPLAQGGARSLSGQVGHGLEIGPGIPIAPRHFTFFRKFL
jgi:hypothetical protein